MWYWYWIGYYWEFSYSDDLIRIFLTTRPSLDYANAKPLFFTKGSGLSFSFPSQAKQVTVIVSPVSVLCIVLHYITAAAMVEMLGMSRFLHQCCLRTYLRPTHNTALLCFVPFPLASTDSLHQTDPFPSGSYC